MQRLFVVILLCAPFIPSGAHAAFSCGVTTQAATQITTHGATVNGTVTSIGSPVAPTRGFTYGTNSNLSGGDTATTSEVVPLSTGPYVGYLTGLTKGTTYYVRAHCGGGGNGNIVSFTLTGGKGGLTKPVNNLGLISYWPMNEATSTLAGDFSGNGNTGTLTTFADPPTSTSGWGVGKLGSGLVFDGTSDYIDTANIADNLSTFSIATWFRSTTAASAPPLVSKISAGSFSTGVGWALFLRHTGSGTTGQLFLLVQGPDGNNWVGRYTTTAYNDGQWHHVVATFNSGTITLYVDGSVAATSPDNGGTLGSFSNSSNVRIGRDYDSNYLSGTIDDIRIYNRVLSQSEVTALYGSNATKSVGSSADLIRGSSLANGLVGLWTFDGKDTRWTSMTAGIAYDRSNSGANGTLTNMNATTARAPGKLGQAFSFDNSDDRIVIGDNSNLHSGDGSVSAWVKLPLSSDNDESLYEGIISGGNSDYLSIELGVNATGFLTNEIIMIDAKTGGAGYVVGYTSANRSELFDDNWHHIVVTADTTTHIYIDGVSKTVTTGNGTDDGRWTSTANINTFRIGDTHVNGTETNFFGGLIDDVHVYNRALSQTEVTQLYRLGQSKIKY